MMRAGKTPIYLSAFSVLLLSAALAGTLNAQQLPQISQYNQQAYMINPAVAGSTPDFEVRSVNRYQWVGVTDAPRTFILSLQGPLQGTKVGLGGYVFTDNVGPTRRSGFMLSYAYHLQLNEYTRLGLGLSAGLMQFTIDGTRITLADQSDPALYSQMSNQLNVDATFGAYLYGKDYYVGVSAPQLLRNRLDLFESADPSLSVLENHFNLIAGYKWEFNSDFMLEPSMLFKYVTPAPLKVDLTARLFYRNMVWVGASWRNNDAAVGMIGYEWKERLSVAYSYDFTTSNLRNYSEGTHELQLGFRFGPDLKAQ